MNNTLLIVESSSKCKKIVSLLGGGYRCIATIGHIRSLTGGLSSFDPVSFVPKYEISDGKRAQVNKIRAAVDTASRVLLAADEDREGEAIAWHTCIVCGLDPETAERITFKEITKSALTAAVNAPRRIDMSLVQAQQARQVLDLMVGFRVSPFLWEKLGSLTSKSLSAGRCQTPALRLVYDNQINIDQAQVSYVYTVTGLFTDRSLKMALAKQFTDEEAVEMFLESSKNFLHYITVSKPVPGTLQPPQPFTTSTLQQKASSVLKMPPKKTEELSQALYVAGLVTYIRTDRAVYSSEFIKTAKSYIEAEYGRQFIGDCKAGKTGPGAQEAHEAIRPTDISREDASLSRDANRLYNLIRLNTIASCMPACKQSTIHISATAPESEYRASVKQILFQGWKILYPTDSTTDFAYFTALATSRPTQVKQINAALSIKNQKPHLNEAKLIHELEARGIGRPSTFPSLVSKIQERGYVKRGNVEGKTVTGKDYTLVGSDLTVKEQSKKIGGERGKLILEPLGRMVMEALLDKSQSLFEYEFTSTMETRLDRIAQGHEERELLCKECQETIDNDFGRQTNGIILDSQHTYIVSKYGPVVIKKFKGKKEFINVNQDVDPLSVQDGTVPLSALLKMNKVLGVYKEQKVELVSGSYGWYIQSGTKKISVRDSEADSMTLEKAITLVENQFNRVINSQVSIRKGPYGFYVFYKKKKSSKPKFLRLTNGITCESPDDEVVTWLKERHNIC
tara:strand:- start:185 stop:2395 length:2211 start_codon:yes stop_codon:yes gene_type:complete